MIVGTNVVSCVRVGCVCCVCQALVREAWMDEVKEEDMTPEQKSVWEDFQAKQKMLAYVCARCGVVQF